MSRDNQFAGYARLLFDELQAIEVEGLKNSWNNIDIYRKQRELLARRAYDLSFHSVDYSLEYLDECGIKTSGSMGKRIMPAIPDMTELPKEQEEGELAGAIYEALRQDTRIDVPVVKVYIDGAKLHDPKKELYAITLKYEGKEYCYLQHFTGRDEEWNAERQVHWMYEEGNYACDCNRSLFLARYLGLDIDLECGNTIELVSIKKESEVLNEEQKKTIGALIVGMMKGRLEGYRKLGQVGVTFTDEQKEMIQKRLCGDKSDE